MEVVLVVVVGYFIFWLGRLVVTLLRRAQQRLQQPSSRSSSSTSTEARRPDGSQTRQSDDDTPTFRVVSLGVSGTGKTVLLASMFNELQQSDPRRSYRLDASGTDRRFLTRLWTELINTDKPWPKGTPRTAPRSFDFDVVPQGQGGRSPMFRIVYIDYSGETLQDGDDTTDIDALETHIDGAQSLFGIIDGRLLVSYLRGEPEGISYMDGDLMTMIAYLARGRAPIHLLITKWDLVEEIGERSNRHDARLRIVREALLDHRPLANLLHAVKANQRTVRLIPVSAVGDDFAELGPGGHVRKRKGARAHPYHLDMPFAAVATDYLSDLTKLLTPDDEINLRSDTAKRVRLPRKKAALAGLAVLEASTRAALRLATSFTGPAAMAAEPMLDLFFDWVERPMLRNDRIDVAELKPDEQARAELHAMRAGVLDEFEKTIWSFESEIPSSILGPTR